MTQWYVCIVRPFHFEVSSSYTNRTLLNIGESFFLSIMEEY